MVRTNFTTSVDAKRIEKVREIVRIKGISISQEIEKLFDSLIKKYREVLNDGN